MTYSEFVNRWNGKFCEMGGSANAVNQCVDLANAYIKEVLGLPIILGTNAIDYPKKCLPPEYEYIKNTPEGVPLQGDIMIYKSSDGIGHIDIFDHGDFNNFVAFSQNWPLKSPCKMVDHVYTGKYTVVGWLRCKIKPVSDLDNMTEQEKLMLDFIRVNQMTEGQLREGFGYIKEGTVAKQSKEIEDLKKSLADLIERVGVLESEVKASNDLVADWQSKYSSATSNISKLEKEIKDQSDEKNQWKNRYEAKCKETADKLSAWELLIELRSRLFKSLGKK